MKLRKILKEVVKEVAEEEGIPEEKYGKFCTGLGKELTNKIVYAKIAFNGCEPLDFWLDVLAYDSELLQYFPVSIGVNEFCIPSKTFRTRNMSASPAQLLFC